MLTTGDYSEDLQELAQQGTKVFMCLAVLIPSLAGILLHMCLGENRVAKMRAALEGRKLYPNTDFELCQCQQAQLPQAIKKPDFDFLILILVVTTSFVSDQFRCGLGIEQVIQNRSSRHGFSYVWFRHEQ